MEYDYTGMRVKKNAPAGISLYPFKGYEIDPNGTITKFIKIGNETFASKKRTSGGVITQYFYHNDHLSGVNVITDITGARAQLNEYEPWGGVSRSEGSTPGSQPTTDLTHRFTGQELDPEDGLYYYGGRYYDAELGRFVSPDPYVQEPDEPQNLNRYSYVLDNPVNLVDPDGHFWWIIAAVIAAITEAITAETITAVVLKTLAGKLVAISFATSIQQLPMKTLHQAELHREVAKQQQSNIAVIQGTLGQFQGRVLTYGSGSDYPDEEQRPWWQRMLDAIVPNAQVGEEGEKPPPWLPPFIPGGVGRVPG